MYRTGIGYDLHRTVAGRPLMLAGVQVPSDFGLDGHSDADVVLHAVCDALLGAAGLGDIGEWFPDDDPRWRGADSRNFLPPILERLADQGWRVVNLDVIIHAQRPRLTNHKPALRAALADILQINPSAVNIKATTNEGLDAIGRGEAIACYAAVLIESGG